MTKPAFTTRAFERSHGRKPSRTAMGTWAFQVSRSEVAFDADLTGEVLFVNLATLAEAKRKVAEMVPAGSLVAVLP